MKFGIGSSVKMFMEEKYSNFENDNQE